MGVSTMSETEDFLAAVLPAYVAAETAIHNGDVEPRLALWSRTDPVTLFGAARTGNGWDELNDTFQWLKSTFSDCVSYEQELVAAGASGDLAYLVALEHNTTSVNGARSTYTLRATTIFRREDGEWKIVHRHGDHYVGDQTLEEAVAGQAR
jgi:ketosteroid isomerase-like protein